MFGFGKRQMKNIAAEETRSLAAPTDLDFAIFGATPALAGVSVSPASALSVPAVQAGIKAISEACSILPLHVYERRDDGSRERLTNHPAYRLLNGTSNPWTEGPQLRDLITADALAYRAKQEAQRAGITLSDQELNSIREKITATEQLSTATKQTAQSAKGAADAQKFFAENFTSALSGLLTGTTTLEGAIQQLANSLINAALQALLLGQGPLAGMAGTSAAAGSASGLGGLFGALFSADGGPVSRDRMRVLHLAGGGNVRGPGTSRSDSIPAFLSNGEFVVNAAATAKNRQILEAINSGRTPKLAGAGKVAGNRLQRPRSPYTCFQASCGIVAT